MIKFHTSKDGVARQCKAKTTESCRATPSDQKEHYNTREEAQKAYENSQSKILFNSLKNNSDSVQSAEKSYTYAQWSLLNNHLHDSIGRGNNAELFYYSSPAGRLELERRIKINNNNDSYKEILKKLENKEPDPIILHEDDKEILELLSQEGENLLSEQFKSDELNIKNFRRVDERVGSFLLNHSQAWLKDLTVEEQEVISHSTSNGFYLVNDSMKKENNIKDSKFNIDKTGMTEKEYSEYAQEFTQKLRNAVEKAPKLDKPIKTYRGIKIHEFNKMFEHVELNSSHEIASKLLDGDLNGQKLPKVDKFGNATKLAHTPISATANPKRSINYTESDFSSNEDDSDFAPVLEIETTTMASPVVVSAWSSGEAEVLTNHMSDYEIIEVRKDFSKSKKILVIKLKEIIYS